MSIRLLTLLACHLVLPTVMASEVVLSTMDTDLVPSPVEYAVIAPDAYQSMSGLPLVINLHGGGGSRANLLRTQPLWDRWWEGGVPPAVVVMPSVTPRGFYMNFKDGSERWEDFIVGPFLAHLQKTLPVSRDPKRTFVTGTSMGGMGSLRVAFRHPDRFGAVAALEPGIEPILEWAEMRPKHRFWRADELLERAYGKPVDADYWAANNPASMVAASAEAIKSSGLQIYIEAGDEDQFWLYEGTEFLHRTLWDARIKHEYHLVRGADHIGPSLAERMEEAVRFLFRSYRPWETTAAMRRVSTFLDRQKVDLDEVDHYNETVEVP